MGKNTAKNTYLLVGGGSGGHITPLIPISEAIKSRHPHTLVGHIGQKGDRLNQLLTSVESIDRQFTVPAGKFRRYHGESWIIRIFDLKTLYFNIRDFFRFLRGVVAAWFLLKKLQPSVLFMKGGYVCAPVGIAAGWLKIPYITHDSDAMVSLAHRMIAKKAAMHLTALPPEFYAAYRSDKTVQVGIPLRASYSFVTPDNQRSAKRELGLHDKSEVLLVVGGGLGAKAINEAIVGLADSLLAQRSKTVIFHVAGHKLFKQTEKAYKDAVQAAHQDRIKLLPFSDNLHKLSAAADVIVTRAGATNMAEFAIQGKACIIVPNPLLTGGHQLKNAKAYEDLSAAIVSHEKGLSEALLQQINFLLDNEAVRIKLATGLHALSIPGASEKIAVFLDDCRRV